MIRRVYVMTKEGRSSHRQGDQNWRPCCHDRTTNKVVRCTKIGRRRPDSEVCLSAHSVVSLNGRICECQKSFCGTTSTFELTSLHSSRQHNMLLRWGCRVPRISTYHGNAGRLVLRPVRSYRLRSISSAASEAAPKQRPAICSSRNAPALALGGFLLGLGYYMGARSDEFSATETASTRQPPLKPVYGTPEDFARAIEELKASFVEDAVTTALDQLVAHGFSPNSHHPGAALLFAFLAIRLRP